MNISALFGLFRARRKLPRNIHKWAQSEHMEDTITSNNTNSQKKMKNIRRPIKGTSKGKPG